MKTIKRDYVYVSDCYSAEVTMELLEGWIKDYNTVAPHSGLGMRSPSEYRKWREEEGICEVCLPEEEDEGSRSNFTNEKTGCFTGSSQINSGNRVIYGVFFKSIQVAKNGGHSILYGDDLKYFLILVIK